MSKVREGVVRGGGGGIVNGWYRGFCQSCGEKLVCIDIDPKEMEILLPH